MTDLRCFCAREPLLAVGRRDEKTGQPYLHVKSIRKRETVVELVVVGGVVRVRCRDCFRWHTVKIVNNNVQAMPEELPSSIVLPGG